MGTDVNGHVDKGQMFGANLSKCLVKRLVRFSFNFRGNVRQGKPLCLTEPRNQRLNGVMAL